LFHSFIINSFNYVQGLESYDHFNINLQKIWVHEFYGHQVLL